MKIFSFLKKENITLALRPNFCLTFFGERGWAAGKVPNLSVSD